MMNAVLWVLFAVVVSNISAAPDFPALDHIRSSTPLGDQGATVQALIVRKIGDRAKEFHVVIDPSIGPANKDTFQLVTQENLLVITGTTGVAAAWGFYYYLKTYCKAHISWAGDQLSLPDTLPTIAAPGVKVTSLDRFRYYQNVCTSSYSFAWWNWTRWEREIDWMAMNGINLPLAFTAQEAIWQRVYLKMNFTQEDLDARFGGPAFLAWARMGNIDGWGGPLPQTWHTQTLAMQHQILDRMRGFGMTPVLPAFAGHVPKAITRVYPKANVSHLGNWGGFQSPYCCTTLLEMSDPLFVKIGQAFIQEYTKEFGTDHIYNADTFNEMTPRSSDPSYLSQAGRGVYEGMLAGDPQAVWLMQAWLFLEPFWGMDQAKALLTSVPQGKMILLDLFSEVSPQYNRLQSYFGQPFIWCMLHNFGGNVQMYGAIDSVNKGPSTGRAFQGSTMIGTGLTPEGINQNDMIYEFMLENAYRDQPRDIFAWMSDYAIRRYGKFNNYIDKAWNTLARGVYNCTTRYEDFANDVVVVRTPSLKENQRLWYDPEDLFTVWDNFLKAAPSFVDSSLFLYDLVDVTRQSMEVIAIKFYTDLMDAYKAKDYDRTAYHGIRFLNLMEGMDVVLGTDKHFLLGPWIESAKWWGTNQQETTLYEYNARNQITLWGPRGEIKDYANKQWSGLMGDYYAKRWALFIDIMKDSLVKNTTFNQSGFDSRVFSEVEQPWNMDRSLYPTEPVGDPIEMSQILHDTFRPTTTEENRFFRGLKSLNHLQQVGRFDKGHSAQHYYSYKMHQTQVPGTA